MSGRANLLMLGILVLLCADAQLSQPLADIYDDCIQNKVPEQGEGPCTSIINSEQESEENRSIAYYNRALTYYESDYYKEAIFDFNEVIAIDPGWANAYNLRGSAVMRSLDDPRQIDWAITNFSKAIELGLQTANIYFKRGWAYQSLIEREKLFGKGTKQKLEQFREKAIADYKKALEIDLSHADAKKNLEELLRKSPP